MGGGEGKSGEEEEEVACFEMGSLLRQLWALICFCEIAAELWFIHVKEGRTKKEKTDGGGGCSAVAPLCSDGSLSRKSSHGRVGAAHGQNSSG